LLAASAGLAIYWLHRRIHSGPESQNDTARPSTEQPS
jgi:hypothetical protein